LGRDLLLPNVLDLGGKDRLPQADLILGDTD
jgi:hypothetical protein